MTRYLKTFFLGGGLTVFLLAHLSCGTSIQDAQNFIENKPPVITAFNADLPVGISSDSIVGGIAVDITVEASDPEGRPLTYDFTSESGSFANKTLTDDGCTVQFITLGDIAGGQDVIISLSVTYVKRTSVSTTLNIGSGKQGPALTLSLIDTSIHPNNQTSFSFSSDSNGYYQIQYLNGVTDPQQAVVDDNIALYRYTASGDSANPNIVSINVLGANALDPGGKIIRLDGLDGVKNVWVLF